MSEEIIEFDHPSRRTKIFNKLAVAALVIIALGVGIFLRWSFQDENIVDVKNQPFPTRTIREHPTGGGVVFVTIDYCKYYEAEGRLRISFVSQTREVFLPQVDERMHKGCNVVEIPVSIPNDIPSDEYRIRFRTVYDLNPLKRAVPDEFISRPVEIEKQQ